MSDVGLDALVAGSGAGAALEAGPPAAAPRGAPPRFSTGGLALAVGTWPAALAGAAGDTLSAAEEAVDCGAGGASVTTGAVTSGREDDATTALVADG